MAARRQSAPVVVALAGAALLSGRALAQVGYDSTINAIELRPEVGSGLYGYELTGNLGVLSLGVRTFDPRWLVSWNGDAELVLGQVAYEHPFYTLYGIQGAAYGEGGARLFPGCALSPYLGLALSGSFAAVGASATINELDGLAGVFGTVGARLGFGGSLLRGPHSLTLQLQPLVELDSAQTVDTALTYFGGALRARYDLRDDLVAIGEASLAAALSTTDAALGTTSDTTRWALAASAIKRWHRLAFGLGLSVSRTATQLAYNTGQTYTSAAPLDARIWLLVGFWP